MAPITLIQTLPSYTSHPGNISAPNTLPVQTHSTTPLPRQPTNPPDPSHLHHQM